MFKKEAVYILIFFVMVSLVEAVTIDCPPSAEANSNFPITVTHIGAVQVAYGITEWNWYSGESYTFTATAPSAVGIQTYYGAADTDGDSNPDATTQCNVEITAADLPTSYTYSITPSTVGVGETISFSVSASDDNGINYIEIKEVGGDFTDTKNCGDATSCTFTTSTTETTAGTHYYKLKIFDSLSHLKDETKSVEVTSTNSHPYFTTTSPLPDATKGVSYSTTIQASDPDGDSITFMLSGQASGMSIDSGSGVLTWSNPDSTVTITVEVTDGKIPQPVSQPFTLTVLPPSECTAGETELCPKQNNICAGSQRECVGGMWSPASCNDVYDDITNYVFPETNLHCDDIDNDCDGNIDEGCNCAEDQTKTETCGLGECKKTATLACSNGQWPACVSDILPEDETCDFLDNDCDDSFDEGGVCTCDKLLGLEVTGTAEITHPADDANFFTGNAVSFLGEENQNINAYLWEFGDGSTDPNKDNSNTYSSPGDYSVKLRVIDNYGCENIQTITIHINSCQINEDCNEGKTCQNGICKTEEITAEITTEEEPLTITIHSPTNQLYAQETIPLSYTTSKPSDCSYSLNNGNFITITENTNSITGKQGANTLTIKCQETTAQRQFIVKLETEPTTVFDELGGEGSGESLFDYMEEKGEEITLTRGQAQEVISEMMQISGLEITKSREISGSSSLIMLNIKNLLPITLENTKLKVTLPKTISETAEEIQSPQEFTVIENDPIIEFLLSLIEQESVIMFEVNSIVDEAMLAGISAETEEDLNSLIQKQQETANAAKITKEFEEFEKQGEKYTKITTKIKPKKQLKGMTLIEKIPKCLAKQIDFIEMDEKYKGMIKVINPDPLIMWHFEEITSEEYFTYEVKGVLSEDCKKQIRSMGIAEELGLNIESRSYFKIILPLLLIPVLGMLIVHFHRFHPEKKEKAEKAKKPEQKAPAKKLEKSEKKIHIEMKEEKDVGKLLDKEIENAEEEFEKGMR